MTFTALATPVTNTPISVSTFGALVKQNFDDLDSRVAANTAILGSWSGGTVISRLIQLEGGNFAKFSQTTGAQTLAAANLKLQFNTTTNSNTSIVIPGGTNQDLFTVQKTGSYFISASVRCANNAAIPELMIYTPGNVAYAVANVKATNGAGKPGCTVCTQLQLNSGDTFAINGFNGGTSSLIDTAWGTASNVTIHYLGA